MPVATTVGPANRDEAMELAARVPSVRTAALAATANASATACDGEREAVYREYFALRSTVVELNRAVAAHRQGTRSARCRSSMP